MKELGAELGGVSGGGGGGGGHWSDRYWLDDLAQGVGVRELLGRVPGARGWLVELLLLSGADS